MQNSVQITSQSSSQNICLQIMSYEVYGRAQQLLRWAIVWPQ